MRSRRLFATLLTLSAPSFGVMTWLTHHGLELPGVVWPIAMVMSGVVAAAVLVHARRFAWVVVSRALLWNFLVWIALLGVVEIPSLPFAMAWWGIACGLALLVLQRDRIDVPAGDFVPTVLHGTLVAVVTMTLADALALAFWSFAAIHDGDAVASVTLAGASSVMVTAFVGLLRLRTWAFALNVVANVAIAAGAWLVPGLPTSLAAALTATAVGQLLAGSPVLWGALRGGLPADAGGGLNRMQLVGSAVIATLIAVIVVDTMPAVAWCSTQ